MDLIQVIDAIVSFAEYFSDSVFLFVSAIQWFFTNIATILTSFFSLLAFVRQGISFLSSFSAVIPPIFLPFVSALFAYWLIMFIIKQGGK